MPRGKFLLDQLVFNGRTNSSITEGPKQSDCLKLGTKVRPKQYDVLKNKYQNKIRDID